jgi:polyhydroxybutyrate depolymerase
MNLLRLAGRFLIHAVTLGAPLLTRAAGTDAHAIPSSPGNYVRHVDVQGEARTYRIHVPKGYNATAPLPIIFAFHGTSASAQVLEKETSFDRIADSLGFFVVYPEGLHRGWNIGDCCRYSFVKHKDETAFTMNILDTLSRGLRIDSSRVYATGYSDGGTLSLLLACGMSSRITAVASVSGTLLDPLPACNLSRPVPVMIIHGTGDHNIPYEGKQGGPGYVRGNHHEHSAPEVTQFWVARDSCREPPALVQHKNVVRSSYDCAGGSDEVVFYTIYNGQHGWPGGGRGWVFSPEPPTDMAATDTITAFFLRHRIGESPAPK